MSGLELQPSDCVAKQLKTKSVRGGPQLELSKDGSKPGLDRTFRLLSCSVRINPACLYNTFPQAKMPGASEGISLVI